MVIPLCNPATILEFLQDTLHMAAWKHQGVKQSAETHRAALLGPGILIIN